MLALGATLDDLAGPHKVVTRVAATKEMSVYDQALIIYQPMQTALYGLQFDRPP